MSVLNTLCFHCTLKAAANNGSNTFFHCSTNDGSESAIHTVRMHVHLEGISEKQSVPMKVHFMIDISEVCQIEYKVEPVKHKRVHAVCMCDV